MAEMLKMKEKMGASVSAERKTKEKLEQQAHRNMSDPAVVQKTLDEVRRRNAVLRKVRARPLPSRHAPRPRPRPAPHPPLPLTTRRCAAAGAIRKRLVMPAEGAEQVLRPQGRDGQAAGGVRAAAHGGRPDGPALRVAREAGAPDSVRQVGRHPGRAGRGLAQAIRGGAPSTLTPLSLTFSRLSHISRVPTPRPTPTAA